MICDYLTTTLHLFWILRFYVVCFIIMSQILEVPHFVFFIEARMLSYSEVYGVLICMSLHPLSFLLSLESERNFKTQSKIQSKVFKPAQLFKKKRHLTIFLQLYLTAIFSWTENLFSICCFCKGLYIYICLCDIM